MTTKTATANGLSKQDAEYLSRIDECLREIKSIHRDIERKRSQGQKVSAAIRRQQEQIRSILDRVEETL